MVPQEIKDLIETKLPGVQAFVNSEDNVHFSAIVIGEIFRGQRVVKQQQMVYAVLGDKITSGEIHALALRTLTPEVWEKEQHDR
ncbi:MAG: BolA family transcriptional regulator [Gammaproteobacteria bacterium]|jgi:acid stress-induced BolA-like protein IbaG/YrbA|nr:BolA family transcriptional regulator [Gammaproteobacteria bacterium]